MKTHRFTRPRTLAEFGAAIRRQREGLELTLDQVMAKTGISKPYLSNIETARAPGPPSPEKIRKIARALELSPADLLAAADWLRTPESVRKLIGDRGEENLPRKAAGMIDLDSMLPARIGELTSKADASKGEHSRGAEVAGRVPLRQVPLINRVAAGSPAEFTDMDYPAGVADAYIPSPDLPGAPVTSAFALKIKGDSMAPEYVEGDIIILGPPTDVEGQSTVHDGDDCVVRLGDQHNFATTFKRIYYVGEAGAATAVRLVPLNPAHAEKTVPLDQVTGIYPLLYRLVLPRRR